MKKYWFLFLLALPFLGQAKCTINGNSTAIQGVNLDLTTGNTTMTFSPNLTGEFTCNSTKDKLNVLKTLDNYVVETVSYTHLRAHETASSQSRMPSSA
nr:hypothetical protein [Escherichia coli]